MYPTGSGKKDHGFTLVELMVVMSIIALLLTIALPRYFTGLQHAKEAVLREDLATMRDAIGHYHADKGTYPLSLETLVESRYLRSIPKDPITDRSDTWVVLPPRDYAPGIADVRSGAADGDGNSYGEW